MVEPSLYHRRIIGSLTNMLHPTLYQLAIGAALLLVQAQLTNAKARIFSESQGNEFVNTSDVQAAGLASVEGMQVTAQGSIINTDGCFDADGNPADCGVGADGVEGFGKIPNCPYDRANRQPCRSDYREPTARCSHLTRGRRTWGMAGTPYSRVLPSDYEDGLTERRTTEFSSGKLFKSPRDISTTVTNLTVVLMDDFNVQIMQWGQFSAHEFTQLAESESAAQCCPDKLFAERSGSQAQPTKAEMAPLEQEISRRWGDTCMPIETEDDAKFGGYLCMEQRRTLPAPSHNCLFGPRQQMNSVTHVFDASAVYGSSKAQQDELRDSQGGKMKTQTVNGKVLAPPDFDKCDNDHKARNRCPLLGGDTRINTTPNLASTHTVFLVAHNKIADRLSVMNPHWDHEKLFQETRRIIAGIQTSIHYYEYLPLILGTDIINKHKLDQYRGFDRHINPSVTSELAHAAYRFGHSTVSGIFHTLSDNNTLTRHSLANEFDDSEILFDGGIPQCLRGLQFDRPWRVDRFFPTAMRDSVQGDKQDIVAFNLNRGRDHGLQSYVNYRRHYGLSVPKTWDDLRATHNESVIESLQAVYTTVQDLEVYIAGVTEIRMPGALVGELFANMMGDGFYRMMAGDRLFFESEDNGLSAAQIGAIKAYKYNHLLCDGGDLQTIGTDAFIIPGQKGTQQVLCTQLPELDLEPWREQPFPCDRLPPFLEAICKALQS